MNLPNRIFFTGVPGSRWSGVAQLIESVPGFNISDRTPERTFVFEPYSDHLGAYFGTGMEFDLSLDPANIDQVHATQEGCRLIKAHEWSYYLDDIKTQYPDDWIILVYRPDLISFAWWNGAGGFNITYPKYHAFKDSINMMSEITKMNQALLEFAYKQNATWNHLTPQWMKNNFDVDCEVNHKFSDILITIIKP
jgi:hypothetical protein